MKLLLFIALLLGLAFPASARQIQSLRGEAFYLERIALPPGAVLHVSLVGRVAGAEYLPLATTALNAQNGMTPFQLVLGATQTPPPPYRLQAWIVADNRLLMHGHAPQTIVKNLDAPVKIRLKLVPAPQNIDGIGDGKPLPAQMTLKGTVSKLDRRALSPDARIEIMLIDATMGRWRLMVRQTIPLEGRQLPQDFAIVIAATDLKPRRRYLLSARIYENGKFTYTGPSPLRPKMRAQTSNCASSPPDKSTYSRFNSPLRRSRRPRRRFVHPLQRCDILKRGWLIPDDGWNILIGDCAILREGDAIPYNAVT